MRGRTEEGRGGGGRGGFALLHTHPVRRTVFFCNFCFFFLWSLACRLPACNRMEYASSAPLTAWDGVPCLVMGVFALPHRPSFKARVLRDKNIASAEKGHVENTLSIVVGKRVMWGLDGLFWFRRSQVEL